MRTKKIPFEVNNFIKLYSAIYECFYDAEDGMPTALIHPYDSSVFDKYNEFTAKHLDFVRTFCNKYYEDALFSDREIAAFMYTVNFMKNACSREYRWVEREH